MSELQAKFEQWAADYSLRFDLAAFKAGAQSQASIVEDANANAPWLSLAHSICTDSGIEHGHITKRLQALQDKLRAIAQPVLPADLIKRMRILEIDHEPEGWPAIKMRDVSALCDRIAQLERENARLNQCITWEQNRAGHIGTHGPNCWTWGSKHYECALLEIKRLNDEERKK